MSVAGRPGRLILVLPLISFGLGTWQLKRLEWKKGVLKELGEKQSATPVDFDISMADDENIQENEYRKFRITGQFDYSAEFHVGPRSRLNAPPGTEPGVHVVHPFVLSEGASSGDRILVNRGWVPMSKKDPELRPDGYITGIHSFHAILRKSDKNAYAPRNRPDRNEWFSLDILAMAQEAETNPVLLDLTSDSPPPGGLPVPGQTRMSVPNDHLQYAITWYSLSVAITALYFMSK